MNPLLDRDRKIYLAGWGQGAGWKHKAIADEMLRMSKPWKPSAKYIDVKPFPAEADRCREFPDGSVENCYRVLSFVEMVEEALAMPEMEKPATLPPTRLSAASYVTISSARSTLSRRLSSWWVMKSRRSAQPNE